MATFREMRVLEILEDGSLTRTRRSPNCARSNPRRAGCSGQRRRARWATMTAGRTICARFVWRSTSSVQKNPRRARQRYSVLSAVGFRQALSEEVSLVADHANALAWSAYIPARQLLFRAGRRRSRGGKPPLMPFLQGRLHNSALGKPFGRLWWRRKRAIVDLRRSVVDIGWRPVPEAPGIERPRDDDRAVIAARTAAAEKQRHAQQKRPYPSRHKQHPCGRL